MFIPGGLTPSTHLVRADRKVIHKGDGFRFASDSIFTLFQGKLTTHYAPQEALIKPHLLFTKKVFSIKLSVTSTTVSHILLCVSFIRRK